jgi:hypothetical protein
MRNSHVNSLIVVYSTRLWYRYFELVSREFAIPVLNMFHFDCFWRVVLEGSKACWFLIVRLELVLSNRIVLSAVCSRSFPYENIFYRVLAWLNCPPYVSGLTSPIHLKSLDTHRHSGHCPVISPESCDPSITTFDKSCRFPHPNHSLFHSCFVMVS